MDFAYPYLLLLLIVAAAAAALQYYLEKRRRAAMLFPDAGPLGGRSRSLSAELARWTSPALKTAALGLIVVGLARPQKVTSRAQDLGRGIDIMLVIDTSLSMRALDFSPGDRLEAAKTTAQRFVLGRTQDRIGLIVFGGAPLLSCPLTHDYDALVSRVGELGAGMTRTEGTALGDGIISGVNYLRRSAAQSKVAIVLTDGRSNAGLIDPITAAKVAATHGVKTYAIGTAKKGDALMPVDDPNQGQVMVRISDDLDEETLAEIARLTGGRYWRAESLQELSQIYAEIDRLEKSEVKLPPIVSRNDAYHKPVLAALALLLIEGALASTVLLRWP